MNDHKTEAETRDVSPWELRTDGGVAFFEYVGWSQVRCIFTTRIGGASSRPYDSLNLGVSTGDDPKVVSGNLMFVCRSCGLDDKRIVRTRQTHSEVVTLVDSEKSDYVGDGLVTALKGTWLAVSVADCVPIFMFDKDKHAVGIVHAGWRGTLKKIGASCVEQMSKAFGSNPSNLSAFFGPGIGPCCYEVSSELASEFEKVFPGSATGRYVDLFKANRMMLENLGVSCVPQGSVCTSCHSDLFFSHRRDKGKTGRMLALIALRPT